MWERMYTLTEVCAYIRLDIFSFKRYCVCYMAMVCVSTYEPIYASLQTCSVCHMTVLCVYIRSDICLSTYMFGMLYGCSYGCSMCTHKSRYISILEVLRMLYGCVMYVSTYVLIHASFKRDKHLIGLW